MTTTVTNYLGAALLGALILSSCSRPVAYFQRGPAHSSATASVQPAISETAAQPIETHPLPSSEKSSIVTEAYVRNDSELSADGKLSERMARAKNMLPTSTQRTLGSRTAYAPHKMNLVEKLMLKKMNRKLSRQLAPHHPERALVNRGQLFGGLVLLIGGLLLLILGTGTIAFIGLIVSLVGALGVILGLFGLDS